MDSLSYSYGIIHAEMLQKNKHFRLDPYESGLSKVCDNKERNVSYDNIFTDVWKGKQYHQKQRQLLYDDSQMTNILYNYKDSFFIGVYIGNQFRKQEIKINKYDYIKAIKDILASRPTNLTFQQAINVINEFNKSRNEPCPGKVKKEAVKKQDKSSDERIWIQSLPEYKQKRYVIYRFLIEDGYDVGDFETFSEKLNNPEKQKSVYNELFRLGFEVGSFSSFAQKICTPHTKESNSSSSSGSSGSTSKISSSSYSSSGSSRTSTASNRFSSSNGDSSSNSSSQPSNDSDDYDFLKGFLASLAGLAFIGVLIYLVFFLDSKPDNNYNGYNNYPVLINPNGDYQPINSTSFKHLPNIRKICDIDLYFYNGNYSGKGELFNVDGELAVKRNHYTEYHPVTRIYTNFDYYFKDGSLTYYFNY